MEFDDIYSALLELKGYKKMFGVNYNDSILLKTFENKQKLFALQEVETLLQELQEFRKTKQINTLDSKAFFKESILAQFPFHLFWKNKKREYEGCNRNYARFHKLEGASFIFGKADKDFYHDADVLKIIDKLESTTLATYTQQNQVIEYRDSENEIRLVHAYRIPIIGKNRTCLGLLGIELPHGQSLPVPNEVKEQNRSLTALLNHSNNYLLTLALNGKIRFANKKVCQTFNLPRQLEGVDFRTLLTKTEGHKNIDEFNKQLQEITEEEEVSTQLLLKVTKNENRLFDARFNTFENEIMVELTEIDQSFSDLFKVAQQTTGEIKMSVNQVVHFRNTTSRNSFHSVQNKIDERLFTESLLKLRNNVIEFQNYLNIKDASIHYKKHDLNELLELAKDDLNTNAPGYYADIKSDILPRAAVSPTMFIDLFQRIIKIGFVQCNKIKGVPIHFKVSENNQLYLFTIECKLPKDNPTFSKVSQSDPLTYSRRTNLSLIICQTIVEKHGGKMTSEWKGNEQFIVRFSLPNKL